MNKYTVIRDTITGDTFGYLLHNEKSSVAYGANALGREWANNFNSRGTKSLGGDLPIGVEYGRTGYLDLDFDEVVNSIKSGDNPYLPEPPVFTPHGSEYYVGDEHECPSIKSEPISNFDKHNRQLAIEYKARSFVAEQKRFSVLTKSRFSRASVLNGGSGFKSKSLSLASFEKTADGPGLLRRVASELMAYKVFALDLKEGWEAYEVEEKKLGRTIGRGARAVEAFDPDAIDGDLDGLVQEGTPWERPATPRARELGRIAQQTRQGLSSGRAGESGSSSDDSKLNGAIFDDLRKGMSVNDAAKKYDLTPDQIEERSMAFTGKDSEILKDRMGGMTLADAAKKYNMSREEVRAREVREMRAQRETPQKQPKRSPMAQMSDIPGDFVRSQERIKKQRRDEIRELQKRDRLEIDDDPSVLTTSEISDYLNERWDRFEFDVEVGEGGDTPEYVEISPRNGLAEAFEDYVGPRFEDGVTTWEFDEAKIRSLSRGGRKDLTDKIASEFDEPDGFVGVVREDVRGEREDRLKALSQTIGFSSRAKSGANRNPDTKNTRADRFDFDQVPGYSSMDSEVQETLRILGANGFGWTPAKDGFWIYPPDRAIPTILRKRQSSGSGSSYVGHEGVLIHGSRKKSELKSIKAWVNMNFGSGAMKDMRENSRKKGDMIGSGKIGEVDSVMSADVTPDQGTPAAMRAAANTRAAELPGMSSSRIKKRPKVAGRDRASDKDGKIWSQLNDDQRKAIEEAAQQVELELIKQATTAFKPWARGFLKDFRDGGPVTPTPEDYKFKNTAELLHLAQYLEERIWDREDITPENKLKYQRILDNLTTLYRMREGKDYEKLEHLHESARIKVVERARKNSPDAGIQTLGKMKGGGDSTFFGRAAGLTKDQFDEVVKGQESEKLGRIRQRLDRYQKRFINTIFQQNRERELRRQLRKQRRGQFRRDERAPVGLRERATRRLSRLRRQARRLVTGRKDEKKIMKAIDVADEKKVVRVKDGKVSLDTAKVDSLVDALKAFKGDPDIMKTIANKGRKGEGDIEHNREMSVIWQAQGMNALPELVGAGELTALIDGGHRLIVRGHGESPQNASDYLVDPIRFLPGDGGEAMGKGEYWADAITGGGWFSWMKNGNTNTVAVLPKNARTISQSKVNTLHGHNQQFTRAYGVTQAKFVDGLDKAPLDEVATYMREQFDKIADDAKDSEIGQLWMQALDLMEKGDARGLQVMELVQLSTGSRSKANLVAPLLGYDAIMEESDGEVSGRVLVMARNSIAALDETVTPEVAKNWVKAAKDASDGKAISTPGTGGKSKKTKLRKAQGMPDWDEIQKMTPITGPTGSQGGTWHQDAAGNKYLVKPAKSAAHAANESAVAAVYRAVTGDGSSTSPTVDPQGKPHIVVRAADISPIGSPTTALQDEAKRNMGVDMVLSNWDAYGAGGQNIGVDPNGKLLRIDAGGGGAFRAQGGDKPSFAPDKPWEEVASMITSPFGRSFYGNVTNVEMAAAMRQVASIDIANIDAAMKAAGVDDATRKLFRDTIAARKREAVRLEAIYAAAPPTSIVKTTGSGAGSTVQPGD